jgi:hypothetical protein
MREEWEAPSRSRKPLEAPTRRQNRIPHRQNAIYLATFLAPEPLDLESLALARDPLVRGSVAD